MAPQITKNLAKTEKKLERCICISTIFDNGNSSLEIEKKIQFNFFLSNCNWQHISQSSRLLAKIPSEMSKRLSLPTLDHFCGNLKHMFQVLEQEEEAWAADSHLESHVIHQYQSQIFLRLFAKAAPAYCLFLKSFKKFCWCDTKEKLPLFDRFMLTVSSRAL